MARLPRLAVGTIQPGVDLRPLTWALMDVLDRSNLRVQNFLSRACFTPIEGATVITGASSRHLDSWLMSPAVCREIFLRSASSADIAIVEGQFAPACPTDEEGGSLATLCEWLDLPRLAVVDASRLAHCALPARPQAEGLLLDGVASAAELSQLQTNLEALWGLPVLGGMERAAVARRAIGQLSTGQKPSRDLCRALGEQLRVQIPKLRRLAAAREFPFSLPSAPPAPPTMSVAVAFDDAFNCYFPDTLDALEQQGAVLRDFSPLRDEALPPGVDIVYLGCGHPEKHAAELAANHCLMTAIRSHVCSGRRIYAEGGGLAYLCRQLETRDGERSPMAGVFPFVARKNPCPAPPRPVEITLAQPTWLGAAGDALKGYLNTAWLLEPTGPIVPYAAGPDHALDLVGRRDAIGSRVHLNFAAQPAALQRFFCEVAPKRGTVFGLE